MFVPEFFEWLSKQKMYKNVCLQYTKTIAIVKEKAFLFMWLKHSPSTRIIQLIQRVKMFVFFYLTNMYQYPARYTN